MSSSFSFLVLSVLVVLLSLCASVSGKPLYANHSLPSGWSHVGRAPSTSYHTVTLALVQRNMAALVEAFHNRTDPFHPQYQQWMSASELHSYTALPASSVQSILDWLTESGIGQASSGASVKYVAGSDAIVVRAQVQHLEAAFSTELSSYTHHEMGSSIAQALNATSHLPDHVAPLVEMVRGLTNMPRKLTPSLTPDGWNRWKPADSTSDGHLDDSAHDEHQAEGAAGETGWRTAGQRQLVGHKRSWEGGGRDMRRRRAGLALIGLLLLQHDRRRMRKTRFVMEWEEQSAVTG